jgi:hypothetical protein
MGFDWDCVYATTTELRAVDDLLEVIDDDDDERAELLRYRELLTEELTRLEAAW